MATCTITFLNDKKYTFEFIKILPKLNLANLIRRSFVPEFCENYRHKILNIYTDSNQLVLTINNGCELIKSIDCDGKLYSGAFIVNSPAFFQLKEGFSDIKLLKKALRKCKKQVEIDLKKIYGFEVVDKKGEEICKTGFCIGDFIYPRQQNNLLIPASISIIKSFNTYDFLDVEKYNISSNRGSDHIDINSELILNASKKDKIGRKRKIKIYLKSFNNIKKISFEEILTIKLHLSDYISRIDNLVKLATNNVIES